MTVEVMMPAFMAVTRNAVMIAVLETVTAAVIEVTGLGCTHRQAECGSDYKCGQAFGEHLSLLVKLVRRMPSPDTAQATRRTGGGYDTYKGLHGLQIRNKAPPTGCAHL
jgi:hypothetical protein